MLIKGVILCLVGYFVYAFFLSSIDGLPPLPPEFGPNEESGDVPVLNDREKMIQQAFGDDCEELVRPIKLLVRDKGMIISAGQFSIEDDGRVKLCPFSAAM